MRLQKKVVIAVLYDNNSSQDSDIYLLSEFNRTIFQLVTLFSAIKIPLNNVVGAAIWGSTILPELRRKRYIF